MHQTVYRKIENVGVPGWEFYCPTCGYRIKIYLPEGSPRIQLLEAGNTDESHGNRDKGIPTLPSFDDWLDPKTKWEIGNLLRDG